MALPPRMRGIARLARLLLSIVLACTLVFGCGATQALLWDSGLAYAVEGEGEGEGEGGESGGSDESGSGSGESGSETDPGSGGSGGDSGGSGEGGSGGSGSGSGEEGSGSSGSESGGSGGSGEGGSGSGGSGGSGSGGSGSGSEDSASAYISNVGILIHDTDTYLGASYGGNYPEGSITSRGGILELDSMTFWNDFTQSRNTFHVQWSVSDSSIAYIANDGVLHAVSDGTVKVVATISGSYTSNGSSIKAEAVVKVTGQQTGRYVSSIELIDPEGNTMTSAPYIIQDQPLDTTVLQFAAKVKLTDPITGEVSTIDTREGTLSTQTDGEMTDLVWEVGQPELAYVDPITGLFRPLEGGLVQLKVYSTAGMSGATVKASSAVRIIDPDAVTEEGYHPQDTLTVKVYYELYPPSDRNDPDDPAYVTTRTFTLSEMQALGSVRGVYTALGSTSTYYTISAEGVPLASVISAAGVNLSGIQSLEFGTADGYSQLVSWSYIYGTQHYYYPNIFSSSIASSGREPVYPILAWKSVQSKNGDTEADYGAMSEATRFRLVTGAASTTDVTSNLQIKWIHTVYVRLAGGPSYTPGDGSGGSEGDGGGAGGGEGSGAGAEEGAGGEGSDSGIEGSPESPEEGGSVASDSSVAEQGAASTDVESGSEVAEMTEEPLGDTTGGLAGGTGSFGESGSAQYKIYQVMNRNDSETDKELLYENALKGPALVLALLSLLIGLGGTVLWYRRQARATPPGSFDACFVGFA